MIGNTIVTYHAVTVATGLDPQVKAALALRLHCDCQWHEGPHVQSHNMLILQKETCKIHQDLDYLGLSIV
jgi:hypothetical protein